MATVERTLTINLRKEILKVPRYKRAKKAVTAIREHLQQHMKVSEDNVKIGKYLNLKIWEHGIKNPIHKVTVLAKKDDKGIVTAELPNIPVKKSKPTKEKKTAKAETKEKEAAVTPKTPVTPVSASMPATPAAPVTAKVTAEKTETK